MCQSILLCVALKAFTNWTLGHVTHWLKFHNYFLLTLCAVSTGEVARAKALVAENLFWRTTSTILTGIFSAMSCMKRLSKTSIKQEVLINVESRLLADIYKTNEEAIISTWNRISYTKRFSLPTLSKVEHSSGYIFTFHIVFDDLWVSACKYAKFEGNYCKNVMNMARRFNQRRK